MSDYSADDWKESSLCQSESGKNLKSGSWDDECEADEDCELVDGTNASCNCHVNGKAYCSPEFESDYFEEWYNLCEDGEANEIYYLYYASKYLYYTLVEHIDSDLDCAGDVAMEYKLWKEIESDYENEIEYELGQEIEFGNQDEEDDSASSLVLGSLLALLLLT